MRTILKKYQNSPEILQLFLLYLISVIIIYFTPKGAGIFFQVLLLVLFFKSHRSYFWFAFMFLVESTPGAIFSFSDPVHNFSLVSGAAGNLYFSLPFIAIAFYKFSKLKKNYPKYFLTTIIGVLIFYFIFLLAGNGIYKWTAILRLTIPWLLLAVIPRLMPDEEHYANFFKLIFPFVGFVLITQVFKLITSEEFVTLIGGIGNPALAQWKDILDANAAIRPAEGIFIPFLSLFGAVYFLTKRTQRYFTRGFLYLIIALSTLSIFITATRAWLLAVIFLLAGYSILIAKNPFKIILRFAFPAFIIFLLFITVPFLKLQADLAFARYETIGYLLQGDITAGGTLSRLSIRAPKVMEYFYKQPFFGWGYGTEGAAFADGHVGHQNLLMQTGLTGYLIFFMFWIIYIIKMIDANKKLSVSSDYKNLPVILILFFLSIHIINTSAQWFNFLTTYVNGFIFAILFSLSNMIYWEAYKTKLNTNSHRIKN